MRTAALDEGGPIESSSRPLYSFYREPLRKHTGRCTNGWTRLALRLIAIHWGSVAWSVFRGRGTEYVCDRGVEWMSSRTGPHASLGVRFIHALRSDDGQRRSIMGAPSCRRRPHTRHPTVDGARGPAGRGPQSRSCTALYISVVSLHRNYTGVRGDGSAARRMEQVTYFVPLFLYLYCGTK
jgi:hypothetical protein